MLLLDGAFRANSVYNDYRNGDDWQRSLSTELASFEASTLAGIYTATAATTASSTFLMLTPYGWIVAVGVGLLLGFGASLYVNEKAKKRLLRIYMIDNL